MKVKMGDIKYMYKQKTQLQAIFYFNYEDYIHHAYENSYRLCKFNN